MTRAYEVFAERHGHVSDRIEATNRVGAADG